MEPLETIMLVVASLCVVIAVVAICVKIISTCEWLVKKAIRALKRKKSIEVGNDFKFLGDEEN